jgi:hypothetical protein
MLMVGDVLRGMADAAAGANPEVVAAALKRQAMDFVYVISESSLARKAAAAKMAARGLNRIAVPVAVKAAGRAATIRFGTVLPLICYVPWSCS